MSQLVVDETPPIAGGSAVRLTVTKSILATTGIGLSFAPLLIVHVIHLVTRQHYQFALLLPVAAYVLVRRRWFDLANRSPGSAMLAGIAAGCAWLVLLAATLLWSPWLGMLAALMLSLAWIYGAWGAPAVGKLFPVWLTLCFALPLPFNLDERLTTSLRTVTTAMSSAVLDHLGILHFAAVNVIELPNRPLFIADACSGINSLFVALAFAMFVGAWNRRSAVQTALLMVCTFGLVLAENVTRLASIAIAARYGWDLAEGWPHQVLGLALFAGTVGFIYSADHLLTFVLRNSMFYRSSRGEGRGQSGLSWPIPQFLSYQPLLAAFLALGILQLWVLWNTRTGVTRLLASAVVLPEFDRESLADEIEGFKRTRHEIQRRVAGDPLGEHSQIWTFERDGMAALVSLDDSFPEIHDLAICYRKIGWSIDHSVHCCQAGASTDCAGSLDSFVEASMHRSNFGQASLRYSLCDRARIGWVPELSAETLTWSERIRRRVQSCVGIGAAATAPGAGVPQGSLFQIQVVVRSATPLTADQEDLSRLFFCTVRDRLYRLCVEQNSGNR